MLWIERVLVALLAAMCEVNGVDSERVAAVKRQNAAAPEPSGDRVQTVYRLR